MPKKRPRRIAHLRRKKPSTPLNLASGIIYAFASIVVVALGGIFYSGFQKHKAAMESNSTRVQMAADIPPGATVIPKSNKARPTATSPSHSTSRTTQAPTASSVAVNLPKPAPLPEAEPLVAPSEETSTNTPSLQPIPHKPWTGGRVDRANLRQSSIHPTADACVPILPSLSKEINGGAATELPLHGNESVILVRYDLERIRGWTISKGIWHGKLLRGQTRSLGFTALTADWEEGTGQLKDPAKDGATYRWADFEKKPWREESAPLTHILRGNGQSLAAYSSLATAVTGTDQWVSFPIDPVIVQALVAGAANTIAITDEKGQVAGQAVFASREDTNNCPYIEIEGGLVDMTAPGAIAHLNAFTHSALRRKNTVGALLSWIAPGDDGNYGQAFMYEVRYAPSPTRFEDATPLPQYKIPWPQPQGQQDRMIVEDLEPNTDYTFFIRAKDETGQSGPISEIKLVTPSLIAYPEAPTPDSYSAQPIDVAAGAVSLQIMDELVGIDPLNGAISDGPQNARPEPVDHSSFWDRSTRTIHLRAAQNETVGFTFSLIQKDSVFPSLTFHVQDFQGPQTTLSGHDLQLYQTRYAQFADPKTGWRWQGDALIPIQHTLSLDKPLQGQKAQSVYAELHVPTTLESGLYRGQISVARGAGSECKLNILLDVLPIQLPIRPRFDIELPIPASIATLYRKDPTNAASIENAYQEIAHDHRCTLAILPYTRTGNFSGPTVPNVSGKGAALSISNWGDWDQRFRSYLSGDPFSKNDRGEMDACHFILPTFENWPTPFANGYQCSSEEIRNADGLRIFAGPSDGVYSCMNSDYWRAFRASLRQFAHHLKEIDVQAATAHVWLNNGPVAGYNGKAPPWSLGHPLYRDDFLALEAFAQVSGSEAPLFGNRLAFRVNVPDPTALAVYGLQRFSILSVSDPTPAAWQLLRERTAMTGETLWLQMNALPLENSTTLLEAIGLRYFLEGADGWTIRDVAGRPEHLTRAQPQSLIYCGLPLNIEGPLPSLRLKALRRTQQDIEYLILLQDKMQWTREQLSEFVDQTTPALRDSATAGSDDLYRLRFAIQKLLSPD